MIKWIKNIFKLNNFKRYLISFITIASAGFAIFAGSNYYISKNVNKSIEYAGGVEVVVQAQVKDEKGKIENADSSLIELINQSLYNRLTGGTGLNGINVSTEGDGKLRITKSGNYSSSQLNEFEKEIVTKPILTITDSQMHPLFQKDGSTISFTKDASLFDKDGNLLPISTWIPPFKANGINAEVGSDGKWGVSIELNGVSGENAWVDATTYISKQQDQRMLIWLNLEQLYKMATQEFPSDWEASGKNLWNFIHVGNQATYQNDSGMIVENALKKNVFDAEKYLISAPVAQNTINTNKTIIQGNFTQVQAKELADKIKFGLSNYELVPLLKYYVEAGKNANAFKYAMLAGIIIFSVIALWMIVNYGLLGALSTISMSLYIFLTLLIFTALRGEYSPSTIAALIIGIGISVDANVITYERLKKQIYEGDSFKKSFRNANRQSLSSIVDANVTTILVGFILFYLGTKDVKGFSITLVLSVLFTLLVMLVFQRFLASMIVGTGLFDNRLYLLGIRKRYINKTTKIKTWVNNFDYLKNSKWFVLSSLIFILIAIIVFGAIAGSKGRLSLGINTSIQFSGGLNLSIVGDDANTIFITQNDALQIKQSLINANLEIPDLANHISISVANVENQSYLVSIQTTENIDHDQILNKVKDVVKTINSDYKVLAYQVSNSEAQKLVLNAMLATGISFIAIVIYLLFRMNYTYSIAAIIGLLHDFLMVVSFIVITRLQISTIVVAAMLAILGLSINDTVVTFDKIREIINSQYVRKILSKEDIRKIANTAIADTLKRSLYTSLTTIFAIVVLLSFQNATDFAFNIIMLFGISIGVYSSIFICTWVWSKLELSRQKRIQKRIQKGYWNINWPEEQTFNGINDYLS
ncbi:protein translocase subunit SecDF [Mycoplasmopsis gallopavonis]|uniref:Protein translocase subunit SecF n=1 Tax=Mycoplasmopsis gallopavonis TaxID=76629 RepID=A0A449B0H2_9BACT|nr:protein translocase subunit SecDF [Mycoplasmopsis gallopavonis]RIV16760.1 protein translocase subunit SecDF [Mycoplasmopsis gallopavonis]VEU73255.1 bifunctional preprotein translocase subunit SecD/SecF [Mycoplasmopsis gallopavonis]